MFSHYLSWIWYDGVFISRFTVTWRLGGKWSKSGALCFSWHLCPPPLDQSLIYNKLNIVTFSGSHSHTTSNTSSNVSHNSLPGHEPISPSSDPSMIYSPPNRDRKNIPLPERPEAVTSSNFLSSSIGSHNNNSFSTNQIEGKYTVNA